MSLGKQTRWDQFETNERLFGVNTDFNEEDYTTKLDRSDPSFKAKEAMAIKLAKEIESTTSTNIHVAEERGQAVFDKNLDEEARYSSVLLNDGSKNGSSVNRKSQEYKKGINKVGNPPGMAPTWSQVAKVFLLEFISEI
jgi:PAB1-binding protein PBP1